MNKIVQKMYFLNRQTASERRSLGPEGGALLSKAAAGGGSTVKTWTKYKVTLNCLMDFVRFPFDTQVRMMTRKIKQWFYPQLFPISHQCFIRSAPSGSAYVRETQKLTKSEKL